MLKPILVVGEYVSLTLPVLLRAVIQPGPRPTTMQARAMPAMATPSTAAVESMRLRKVAT